MKPNLKSRGPITEPCGTPPPVRKHSDVSSGFCNAHLSELFTAFRKQLFGCKTLQVIPSEAYYTRVIMFFLLKHPAVLCTL